jgi:hypothetical protein
MRSSRAAMMTARSKNGVRGKNDEHLAGAAGHLHQTMTDCTRRRADQAHCVLVMQLRHPGLPQRA